MRKYRHNISIELSLFPIFFSFFSFLAIPSPNFEDSLYPLLPSFISLLALEFSSQLHLNMGDYILNMSEEEYLASSPENRASFSSFGPQTEPAVTATNTSIVSPPKLPKGKRYVPCPVPAACLLSRFSSSKGSYRDFTAPGPCHQLVDGTFKSLNQGALLKNWPSQQRKSK
jgi:hypothetical protein